MLLSRPSFTEQQIGLMRMAKCTVAVRVNIAVQVISRCTLYCSPLLCSSPRTEATSAVLTMGCVIIVLPRRRFVLTLETLVPILEHYIYSHVTQILEHYIYSHVTPILENSPILPHY